MNTPDYPRMIRPRDREFDSDGEYEFQEFGLADSDLSLNVTHRPDGDTTILLVRDGVEAGIIADEDDNITIKTQD
ncbi:MULTISPECIES: hypothetical protein [Halorussus]|uniref:hypothetical protein n=1 Tax=Halorussus TaxID=1070314 RepID=UPI000E216E42|nr:MULTISPECIES: hypothetical protein [Halorussus]NHN60462.1 hypothetical protein [Halorussus sp. JP-T4]